MIYTSHESTITFAGKWLAEEIRKCFASDEKLQTEVNNKKYFALLPLKGEKQLDFSQSYMLYEIEEDEENNPIVMYIEDDIEFAIAAQYFSNQLSKK